jgi:putative Holliday junction resolvase
LEQIDNEKRIMGIDFGEKRIGIALSDPLFTFAYAFTTLLNDSRFSTNLSKIINEKKISKVILGFPSEDLSHQKLSQKFLS